MFEWIYKPVRKIKPPAPVEKLPEKELSITEKILSITSIDTICNDPVTGRSFVTMNTVSVVKLIELMAAGKDVQNQHLSAVSLSIYFKEAGLPPSECIERLNAMVQSGMRIPSKIHNDLTVLYEELRRLESL
ncbi:hypothetical protein [Flavobacterium sp.]|jgi:hypothetical protein|uniref:hypothetical protein n=1 Tax=Flavobacterium sp. TaxID=239 RepID=UPI0037BE831C